MKKTTDSIFNTIKRVTLTQEEKATLNEVLLQHIEKYPYNEQSTVPHPSPYINEYEVLSFFTLFTTHKKYSMSVAAVLLLSVSFGTSFVAASALPGDLLYPIKINVNESIELAVAPTVEAKASINTKHALKRLEEAQTLLEQGRLDATTTAEIKITFDKKMREVTRNIEELSEKKEYKAAVDSSAQLQDGLNRHYTSLLVLGEKDEKKHENKDDRKADRDEESVNNATSTESSADTVMSTSTPKYNLVEIVKNNKNEITRRGGSVERKFVSSVASVNISEAKVMAEVAASSTEKKINELQQTVASSSTLLSVKQEAESRLAEAVRDFKEALVKIAGGDYIAATVVLHNADTKLIQVSQFIEVGSRSSQGFKKLLADDKEEIKNERTHNKQQESALGRREKKSKESRVLVGTSTIKDSSQNSEFKATERDEN